MAKKRAINNRMKLKSESNDETESFIPIVKRIGGNFDGTKTDTARDGEREKESDSQMNRAKIRFSNGLSQTIN